MKRIDLEQLNKPQLIDLVQQQTDLLQQQTDKIQELSDTVLRLQVPAKTSRTSSKPPSTDKKARREAAKPGGAKLGHKGHNRNLHAAPNQIIDYRPHVCTTCHKSLPDDLEGDEIGAYDEIDIPPITTLVRRHRRLCVRCPHCRARCGGRLYHKRP